MLARGPAATCDSDLRRLTFPSCFVILCGCRRLDAATINRIIRRQNASIEGQRKGVSNDLRNCANEFEIFIDPMTTQATMDGKDVCRADNILDSILLRSSRIIARHEGGGVCS